MAYDTPAAECAVPITYISGSEDRTVYIRLLAEDEYPADVEIPDTVEKLYAVFDETGLQLALTDDRNMAFSVARQSDRQPVSVH